jgi:hypothetical protein
MEGAPGLALAAEDRATDLPDHRVVPLDKGSNGELCQVTAASREALEQLPVRPVAVPASNSTPRAVGAVRFRCRITSSASLGEGDSASVKQPPGSHLFWVCTGI